MPNTTEGEEADYAEQLAANASVTKSAWQATLDEMDALADEFESEGWQTVRIAAGHTAPENPSTGDSERFGLTHVVPNNKAEEFTDLFEEGAFPQYEVYRNEVEGREFVLTVLTDPEKEAAILIAGSYELRHAPGCVRAAKREEKMYTHVQTLDKTHLGSFEHDDYTKFFPNADRIENWVTGGN
jgi:hypothetical protein